MTIRLIYMKQIRIDRIGEEIEVFVVDYKQSCKNLQASPSRCGGQPRQRFSAKVLAVGMPSNNTLEHHPTNTLLNRSRGP